MAEELRRGPWTVEEDLLLANFVAEQGKGQCNALARRAGQLYLTSRRSINAFHTARKIHRSMDLHIAKDSPPELAFARMKLSKLISSMRDAETEKIQLMSQLCVANDEAKDIALRIEEANCDAMACALELQSLTRASSSTCSCTAKDGDPLHCGDHALRELGRVKQQIYQLKLHMAAALRDKVRAEAEVESLNSSRESYSRLVEQLRSEVEEVNVEQVPTDLCRTGIERELRSIQEEREVGAARFAARIRKLTSRIAELRRQICSAKKLEAKLLTTTSDAQVLENEMETIRSMNRKALQDQEISSLALRVTATELEAAKNGFSRLKAEAFALMDEMDAARREVVQIAERKQQSSKRKQELDSRLQSLSAELHQTISKTESAAAGASRAESILSTLSAAVSQLRADEEAARREEEMAKEEAKSVRHEAEATKLHAKELQGRFHEAMAELKAAKASEAKALEDLKEITERTMKDRAISALWSSTITISKFEYYYLVKQAKATQLVADKKVSAARAWREALEAEKREKWTLVPIEGGRKDTASKPKRAALLISRRKVKEDNEREEKAAEGDQQMKAVNSQGIKLAIAMPRRSLTIKWHNGDDEEAAEA